MDLKPSVLAFAIGFGVFIAFVGAAVAAPPGALGQLLVAGPLVVAVTPLVYWVFDADLEGGLDQRGRRLTSFLVGATLTSTVAAVFVPAILNALVDLVATPLSGIPLSVIQLVAFLGVFAYMARTAVNWIEQLRESTTVSTGGASARRTDRSTGTTTTTSSGDDFSSGWDDVFDDEANNVEQIVGDNIDEGLDDLARDDAVPLAEVVNEPDMLDEVVSDGGDATDPSRDDRPRS